MFTGPHPTELPKTLDPDHILDDDRNLFCEHYIRCLDEAVSQHWASWTCEHCALANFALRSTTLRTHA